MYSYIYHYCLLLKIEKDLEYIYKDRCVTVTLHVTLHNLIKLQAFAIERIELEAIY